MNYCGENYVWKKNSTIVMIIDNTDNVDSNDKSNNCRSAVIANTLLFTLCN